MFIGYRYDRNPSMPQYITASDSNGKLFCTITHEEGKPTKVKWEVDRNYPVEFPNIDNAIHYIDSHADSIFVTE